MALTALVLLSALFALTHIGLSHGGIRRALVTRLGTWPFRGLYSGVSLLTLGGAVAVFWGHRHLGPLLWTAPRWVTPVVVFPLMFLAFELFALMLAAPSPASMIPARAEARGVLRITRHPMNMAFACFGLAHLIANGTVGDASFFGSIFAVGFFGAYHQDRRVTREQGESYRALRRETSVLPFAAIATGKARLDLGELGFPLVAIGFAAFVVLAIFHGRLFGAALF